MTIPRRRVRGGGRNRTPGQLQKPEGKGRRLGVGHASTRVTGGYEAVGRDSGAPRPKIKSCSAPGWRSLYPGTCPGSASSMPTRLPQERA